MIDVILKIPRLLPGVRKNHYLLYRQLFNLNFCLVWSGIKSSGISK